MDDEYYYVTYTAIGFLGGAGIIRQQKIDGREIGDFNIASASQYLFKLLEVPCIIQNWHLITKKRADELNAFAKTVVADIEKLVADDGKVTHLKLVSKMDGLPPEGA